MKHRPLLPPTPLQLLHKALAAAHLVTVLPAARLHLLLPLLRRVTRRLDGHSMLVVYSPYAVSLPLVHYSIEPRSALPKLLFI